MKRVVILALVLVGAGFALSLAGVSKATAQLPSGVLHPEGQPQGQPEAQPQGQAAPQQATLVGPTQFDGSYSVEIVTQDGSCANTHWTVAVAHGQIASITPNNSNITASGLIEDDGTVSMTFRGGKGDVAHVGGTVKGDKGNGAWSSPTLLCGGVWRADKQK